MFDRSIRTNNDCEGWHRRLHSKIRRHNLPMYQLAEVIHKEAQFVDIQAQFLADDKLTRRIRKKPRTDQARILSAWQKFKSNDCTSKDLLRVVSDIYKPCIHTYICRLLNNNLFCDDAIACGTCD